MFTRALVVVVLTVVLVLIVGPFIHPAVPVPKEGYVFITGCTEGGLGFEVLKEIINTQPSSIKVVCTLRKLQDVEPIVNQFGGTDRVVTIIADVADEQRVKKLENEMKEFKIIGLVNNAGIGGRSSLEVSHPATNNISFIMLTPHDLTNKNLEYRSIITVNLFGLLDVTKALLSNLKRSAPGSRIVNIGSMAGTFGRPNALAYTTSKRAVEAATDVMRMELAPQGISVAVIQAGYFASKLCNRKGGTSNF